MLTHMLEEVGGGANLDGHSTAKVELSDRRPWPVAFLANSGRNPAGFESNGQVGDAHGPRGIPRVCRFRSCL